jgi:hypothetical protein
MEKSRQNQETSLTNAYSLFVYAIRTQITKDYYLRRLRSFFDYIKLLPNANIELRCNQFAAVAIKDPKWTFGTIINFLQYQKERVEREEITAATLYNFVKALKLFCEMSDVPIAWKKITRGLPKVRSFANDRAPTIEEIRKMTEYSDRRMKAIVYTMASSGIRLGAWDYLHWKDIEPISKDGRVVAAKVTVYSGEEDEYFSFITPEALSELERWVSYKQKFAPFTKAQRRKRRMEVYKLHFEQGVPATRIAELMKVDRNTINNDLKILYRKALNDYNPDDISLDDLLQKQLLRLETQRDRLGLYLSDAKDINDKIAIERLIADIDFKLLGAIEKVNHNIGRFWDEIIKEINRIAKEKKLDIRYTSLFELHKISIDSRESLDKLKEEVLNEKRRV